MPPSISRELLPMKAHYFFFYAGIAPIILFMSTYAKEFGFSSGVVGFIYTILPIMGMLAKLFLGAIADKFQSHKFVVLCSLSLAMISFFCLIFIPTIDKDLVTELRCNYESGAILKMYLPNVKGIFHDLKHGQKNDSTANCRVECTLNTELLKTMCKQWRMSRYCEPYHSHPSSERNDLVKEGNFMNSELFKTLKDYLISLIQVNNSPKTMKFYAQLISSQISEQDQSLHIKILKVRDIHKNSSWYAPYCNTTQISTCSMFCENFRLSNLITPSKDSNVIFNYIFWWFFIVMIFGWIGTAAVTSVGDSICFALLGDFPHKFGIQRLWGSVGWGFCAPFVGFLIDYFSIGKPDKDYTPLFYLVGLFLAIDLLIASCLQETERIQTQSIIKEVRQLFFNIRILIFFIWCVVIGIGACVIWNFLFWYLENLAGDNQKWIKTLEGLLVCCKSICGELPFFFLNSWLLKKLGHVNCMSLVLLAFGIKFILYSLLVNPWWSLPIELLGGLTFSTFYATMASYASIVAPPGTEATLQGIVGALYEGVGISTGSLMGGLLFEYYDNAFVFRMCGIVAIVLFFLHILIHYFLGPNPTQEILSSASSQDSVEDDDNNLYSPEENETQPLIV
ncbi:major facilitator superfamily domain-containing protein 6-like [Lycorma delicatula]|uniref:major facilitator superfamily domain-containing protein 6-like n=1 Tax=Lycorma delicatula TaxID=130591 RepID=UPI003F51A49B